MFMRQALYQAPLRDDDKSKGFTLIELLVVIGIMAILASIALIMLRGQHVIAMNSAALSDLNTTTKHEEGLYVDYDYYGSTRSNQNNRARNGKGDAVAGTGAVYLVTRQNSSSNPERMEFRLSENVRMVVAMDNTYQSYVITAKHTDGDRRYCYDSDSGAIYYDNRYAAGTQLTRGRAVAAQLNRDDCARIGTMSPL